MPIFLHHSNLSWKTSLHCDEEPQSHNIEFCASLGR